MINPMVLNIGFIMGRRMEVVLFAMIMKEAKAITGILGIEKSPINLKMLKG